MADIIKALGYLAGGSRFRRIYEHLQLEGDKIYKDADINFKSSWFPVYYTLSKSDESQTVMGITSQIAFTHITVKNIVKELEKEGLIKVTPNPADKRSKLISLSSQGLVLLEQLKPLWQSMSRILRQVLIKGHPDIMNILERIDEELKDRPLHTLMHRASGSDIDILDYRPDLKPHFDRLARPWLLEVLDGQLEEEDKFSLENPDLAYLQHGGFLFFAEYNEKVVGCAGLKRLDQHTFELVKLFIGSEYRQLGIGTKLLERCISRCKENMATELWLQTTLGMPRAHRLYEKLGFIDMEAPAQMFVLNRTEKIMCLSL